MYLAPCRWRTEAPTPGHVVCKSALTLAPPSFPVAACGSCPWPDHEEGATAQALQAKEPQSDPRPPCFHLGKVLDRVGCNCPLRHVHACEKHERCTRGPNSRGLASCASCPDYDPDVPDQTGPNRTKPDRRPDQTGVRPADLLSDPVAFRDAFQELCKERREPPLHLEGRGVVTCAGGDKFFACAWVQVSVLRFLGCHLPVEVWHLGPGEMDPAMRGLLESLGGVRVVDALEVAARLPAHPRILNGWELKPFAVIHSAFAEVLFLDADNYPARDPSFLFNEPSYLAHGALFWPDLPPRNRREWLPAVCWNNLGLEYRNEPDFESGQMLIDKRRCWDPLRVTMWLNEHSDYVYKFVYGDKSTFHLAWRGVGLDYALAPAAGWRNPAILQHDPQGQVLFLHCCQGKEMLAGRQLMAGLPLAEKAQDAGNVLARLWRGRVWDWRDQSAEEHRLAAGVPGQYLYDREGLGARPLDLLPGGEVGLGKGGCERRWTLRVVGGVPTLVITGEGHKSTEIGMMFLRQDDQGIWRGRWTAHERGPVSLTPVLPQEPPAGWLCRPGTWDRDIWDSVVRGNEYSLPAALPAGSTVVDVGAHTGSFALACLARGAARVVCVEPEADNARLLRGNLAPWTPRAEVVEAACWPGCKPVELFHPVPGHPNTGAWQTRPGAGTPAVDLDDLLRRLGAVRLLKLDCEGAEFWIIAASRELHRVTEIVGEYHEKPPGDTADSLRSLLEEVGFAAHIGPPKDGIGLFRATRTPPG